MTDLAIGPYQGKETGETALLRTLFFSLAAGDIAVMDRCDCSFRLIALPWAQWTHTCVRKHHLRHSDFRHGRLEPRVLKRRRHGHKLVTRPRNDLRNHCT